jgi:hypothetical protein
MISINRSPKKMVDAVLFFITALFSAFSALAATAVPGKMLRYLL